MGVAVLVLGKSGAGKSTSLRNFGEHEVCVLNVLGKPLPFRGRLDHVDHPEYRTIREGIGSGAYRAYVVDDAGYMMQLENFARASESGYGKFTDMAVNFQSIIKAATLAPAGTVTYFLMHTEEDMSGHEKVKTVGKMLDEKFGIEGACPIVIDCVVRDGRHIFVTKNDGTNLAKAPMGMLPDEMDNDLKLVDTKVREYWGMPPLADSSEVRGAAGAGR